MSSAIGFGARGYIHARKSKLTEPDRPITCPWRHGIGGTLGQLCLQGTLQTPSFGAHPATRLKYSQAMLTRRLPISKVTMALQQVM